MYIRDVLNFIDNLKPYDKGTDNMWTDSYVSKQLLLAHINPNITLGSRKPNNIYKAVNFITKQLDSKAKDILDLGCGPGLYAKKFARKGYNVTGIDFSKNSIEYAINQARKTNLNINYIYADYLTIEFTRKFDLIIMLHCDFCVLSIKERTLLINKIYAALNPGGLFIFDILNENSAKNIDLSKTWEMSHKGFWKDKPYICLSQSFHYPKNKAILDQHVVFDEYNNPKVYRFLNYYFDKKDITDIFRNSGFESGSEYQNILENDNGTHDTTVTFYKMIK